MKSLFISAGFLFASGIMAEEKIDYSHCKEHFKLPAIVPQMKGFEDYPFGITEDGKIKAHDAIKSYSLDEKTQTEKIVFLNYMGAEATITVLKDDKGRVSKIINTSTIKGPKIVLGIGGKKADNVSSARNPMPLLDTEVNFVTDLKIQNGKCFPYRTLSEENAGNITRRHFLGDSVLCKEIRDFYKKNPQVAGCGDMSLVMEMNKIIQGHQTRNLDVYDPEAYEDQTKAKELFDPFKGKYDEKYDGEGFDSDTIVPSAAMTQSITLDKLLTESTVNPLATGNVLAQYCNPLPGTSFEKLMNDDDLFKEEKIASLKAPNANTREK